MDMPDTHCGHYYGPAPTDQELGLFFRENSETQQKEEDICLISKQR
jgi:hypothetical protein